MLIYCAKHTQNSAPVEMCHVWALTHVFFAHAQRKFVEEWTFHS